MACHSEAGHDVRNEEEFGRIELSTKMKDFIANQMLDRDWKDILRRNLPDESEDEICYDNKRLYDRSYAVVRKLCEKGIVVYLSDMIEVLNLINKGVAKKATNKFQGPRVARVENLNEEHDFELSSEMRLCISLKVGREWKRFARNFDIEDEVIDDIDEDGDLPTLQDKCHQVFKKLEVDKVVKWNLVKEALDEIGKRNIITEFEKKF